MITKQLSKLTQNQSLKCLNWQLNKRLHVRYKTVNLWQELAYSNNSVYIILYHDIKYKDFQNITLLTVSLFLSDTNYISSNFLF